MRKNNIHHYNRVMEELHRISDSPAELARILRIDAESARRWLTGESLPSLGGLEIMYRAGIDIFYVVTGVRMLQDIPHTCETCAHYCDGYQDICHANDYDCAQCPNNDTCRTCRDYRNWQWRHQPGFDRANTIRE